MKLSVVVPARNRATGLSRLLDRLDPTGAPDAADCIASDRGDGRQEGA